MMPFPRLYAIADASFGDPVQLAQDLFDGGARLLQVRHKTAGAREFLESVERILNIAPAGSQVIVNDRLDIAIMARAAGVHLGQTDLPAAAARQIMGPGPVVGLSTHNLAQAVEAESLPVDYIAVGPIFQTSTKENPDPAVGIDELERICRAVGKPVVAIGGITRETARSVIAAGAASIAVIRDLLESPDVADRTREYCRLVRM